MLVLRRAVLRPMAGLRVPRPGMATLAVLVSAFALLPLGFIAVVTIQTGWAASVALIFRPRVGELLFNTALLIAFALPITAVVAVAMAWATERSDLRHARVWSWLCVAPLAVPAFVHSYAWVTLVPGLHGAGAGVLISVIAYFPFVYLPVAATLRRLDPALEDAAASLGQTPVRVFIRVVVPQLRLALLGGLLLVALHLLGEYGLFVFIRFDTFTTAIVDQFQSTFSGPAANMLAGVLVVCTFAILGGEFALRGNERFARVGQGAARRARRTPLGRAAPLVWAAFAISAALTLGVPFLTIGRWLVAGGTGVWRLDVIGMALGQTAVLAVLGGLVTVAIAIPLAWLSIRRPGPMARALESSNSVIAALPGAVVALALVTVTVRVALPLYQSVATILVAYALMFFPRALITLRASIAQAPVELEDAACGLGLSPLRALWRVTVQLAAPGAAAGTALVALGIMNELTATQMLAPNGTRTLAMAFWAMSGELDYAGAAPYALLMVALSLPLTLVLFTQSRRMAGQ